jgi:hypothetical protein
MVTRRTAVGATLAFASVASALGLSAFDPSVRCPQAARSIDALLIDGSVEMPGQIIAFINASRRAIPVVGIQLDAAAQAGLTRVLHNSRALLGISCGATLFCLERIAWDHGFRLTERNQRCYDDLGSDTCRQDMVAFLGGAHPPATPSPLARVYRPSRADGTLHAWVMQKSASHRLRAARREV